MVLFHMFYVLFQRRDDKEQQQQQQAIDELQNTDVSTMHCKTVTGDKMTHIGNVYFIVKMMFFTLVQL